MNRFKSLLVIFVVLLLLFGSFSIAHAQDTDPGDDQPAATVEVVPSVAAPVEVLADAPVVDAPEAEAPTPVSGSNWENVAGWIIAFLTVLIGLDRISGSLFSRRALDIASRYIDPAIAQQIYDTAFARGLQYNLDRAAKTPGTDDDEFWLAAAQSQGFAVTKSIDGYYVLSKPAREPAG